MTWKIYALLSMAVLSVMVLLITSQTKKGVSVAFVMLLIGFIWFLGYGFWTYQEGVNFQISKEMLLILTISGILSIFGNWLLFQAATLAPNPGVAFAISDSKAALITLLSIVFLGTGVIDLAKIVGILMCVSGIIMLNISK